MRALAAAVLALAACHCRDQPPKLASTTTLVVRVTDHGQPVGARVLLRDAAGTALHIGRTDLYDKWQARGACPIAPAVVGSWDGLILGNGTGEIPIGADTCDPAPAIPYGHYQVWAWRGIEYELWKGEVDLAADRGRVALDIALERAWTPHGTLAADLHVHAQASNDSTVPNKTRVVAQTAAGIQVIGLSDHNTNGDVAAEIRELGLERAVATIASNELTSEALHVGVYPVTVARGAPANGGPPPAQVVRATATEMFALARSLPGHPVVQLNHPRFRVTALYDGTHWDGVAWPPPFPLEFDAVEVLAGYTAFNAAGDRRFDDSVRDFYTLVDHGHVVAALGNSDTHDLNRVLDGTTRNYVYVDDPRTAPFDEPGFVAAIRAHRVVATSGPWLDVEVAAAQGQPTVGPGQSLRATGSIWLDVTLAQARFVHCEHVRVTVGSPAGPRLAQTIDVPAGVRTHHWAGAIDVGGADTWLAVTADGDQPLPAELTGVYQQVKWNRPGVTPFAIANPILIDADGDGRWKRGDADLPLQR